MKIENKELVSLARRESRTAVPLIKKGLMMVIVDQDAMNLKGIRVENVKDKLAFLHRDCCLVDNVALVQNTQGQRLKALKHIQW